MDYYRRTHTAGEQARPYGCVRNGCSGYGFIAMGDDVSLTQNHPISKKPNVGAGPTRPQGVCEYLFPNETQNLSTNAI